MFSGIGSPECAMPHWQWPWHAEIERFPSAVMAARHPQSVNLGNVSAHDFTSRAKAIASPDVLVFGSPCQSFSVAGKRLGLDDPRGNLALVALGNVARIKPRWFVFENVPGLLSIDDGRAFGTFLGTVEELGYRGAWSSLDAQHFGVAQRRERLFFVGHSGDWRGPAAVLLEPESLRGHHPPRRQAGQGVAPTIASRPTGGGGLGTDFDCDGGLIAGTLPTRANHGGTAGQDALMLAVANTLNAHTGIRAPDFSNYVAHALRADGFDASEDGTGRGTPLIAFDTTQITSKTNRCQPQHGNPCHPITARGHAPAIAQTLTSHWERSKGASAGNNSGVINPIIYPSGVRRLTPRECERLQGFPDDYTLVTHRGKPAADGPRYKAIGNSMAVPVMRWILSRIENVHELTREK